MLDSDTLQQPSPLKAVDSFAGTDAIIDQASPPTGDVAASNKGHCDEKIIKKIIACCNESIETDVMSAGLFCVHCNKEQPGTKVDIWQPIGRSDTYWIRNTLQSMLG